MRLPKRWRGCSSRRAAVGATVGNSTDGREGEGRSAYSHEPLIAVFSCMHPHSVGAILVIAQWGCGAGRIQDSSPYSISGLTK
jgi:hypothetical protein